MHIASVYGSVYVMFWQSIASMNHTSSTGFAKRDLLIRMCMHTRLHVKDVDKKYMHPWSKIQNAFRGYTLYSYNYADSDP